MVVNDNLISKTPALASGFNGTPNNVFDTTNGPFPPPTLLSKFLAAQKELESYM
jgi:hypothetical protein